MTIGIANRARAGRRRLRSAALGGALFACLAVGQTQPAPTAAIKVDQAGYLPSASKVAFVTDAPAASRFVVRQSRDDSPVFEGTLGEPVDEPDSGDRVRAADFSALRATGRFYLDVPGVGRSWPFDVRPDVYVRPLYLAMRSFYGQRCGIAVDLGPPFRGYAHGICHRRAAYHASSGRGGEATSPGGWHDAGDYGRYIVNSGISTGTLLWAWELYRDRLASLTLDIPESSNHVPDMLDEIRWNLEWMRSMQDDDGGVWHKQTSEAFTAFVMPEDDPLVSYVIGTGAPPFKSTCATADFAAVMAIAGRVYRGIDDSFAQRAERAARSAWSWTVRHPQVLFQNPAGVSTGDYRDRSCDDERLWAAAELWRTTGDPQYDRFVVANEAAFRKVLRPIGPPAWPTVGGLGLWTYVLGGRGDAALIASLRDDILRAARAVVERTAKHGYRTSMTTTDYVWGSNGVAANYGVQLLVAHALAPDAAFLEAARDNLHYLLGRNTFSLSWVTHVGANPFRHPHHRPSGADRNPEPWPGLLSGGPNASRQDPAMKKLPDLPPAKMYLDEQESYATNENAINWNAPLVFLLAGASQ